VRRARAKAVPKALVGRYLRFRLALWLWARWFPVLAYRRNLSSLLDSVAPGPRRPFRGLPAAIIVRRVKKAVRQPLFMSDRPCLREGLLAMRFLELAGYTPELHFGIDKNSVGADRLRAHCWVTLESEVILNPPEPNLETILVRPKNGAGAEGRLP